jgi:hypothetical protein
MAAPLAGLACRDGITISNAGMVIAENFIRGVEKNPHLLIRQLFTGIDPLHLKHLLLTACLLMLRSVIPYQQEQYQNANITQLSAFITVTLFYYYQDRQKGYNFCYDRDGKNDEVMLNYRELKGA